MQYADDMATAARSVEKKTELSVETINRAYDRYGLTVNAAKTKILSQPAPGERIQLPDLRVSGSTVKNVAHFPYLGSTLTADATCEEDVVNRIEKAHATYGKQSSRVFRNNALKRDTKLKVYRATVYSDSNAHLLVRSLDSLREGPTKT